MSVNQRKKKEINNFYSFKYLYLVYNLVFDNFIQFLYISAEGHR